MVIQSLLPSLNMMVSIIYLMPKDHRLSVAGCGKVCLFLGTDRARLKLGVGYLGFGTTSLLTLNGNLASKYISFFFTSSWCVLPGYVECMGARTFSWRDSLIYYHECISKELFPLKIFYWRKLYLFIWGWGIKMLMRKRKNKVEKMSSSPWTLM